MIFLAYFGVGLGPGIAGPVNYKKPPPYVQKTVENGYSYLFANLTMNCVVSTGSMAECLTRDWEVAGSSLTAGTAGSSLIAGTALCPCHHYFILFSEPDFFYTEEDLPGQGLLQRIWQVRSGWHISKTFDFNNDPTPSLIADPYYA